MTELGSIVLLSAAVYAVINYLKAPLVRNMPDLDLWWLVYAQFVLAAAASAAAQFNAFTFGPEWLGIALTAAAAGGGSELIYQIFGKPQ